jgi:tetratricopeptide (TPR) repeat protein
MDKSTFIKECRELITANKVKESIGLALKEFPSLKNDLINLQRRWTNILSRESNRTEDFNNCNIEKNKIIEAFLIHLDSLEKGSKPNSIESAINSLFKNRKRKSPFLISLGVLISVLSLLGYKYRMTSESLKFNEIIDSAYELYDDKEYKESLKKFQLASELAKKLREENPDEKNARYYTALWNTYYFQGLIKCEILKKPCCDEFIDAELYASTVHDKNLCNLYLSKCKMQGQESSE